MCGGVTIPTLNSFNVTPISYFWLDDSIIKADTRAYAYGEKKDGMTSYKIYQPNSKSMKWLSNVDKTIHQGYTNLPASGELLIITKSLKDVMSLHDTLGISCNNEAKSFDFDLKLLDLDTEQLTIPNIDYNVKLKLLSTEYRFL